jgi:nitrite reductase (NADH) large subunit
VGIEHLRSVIVDDAEGLGEQLDAAMQASIEDYVDPWSERADPFTPGQFRTALPLEVLPHVPVKADSQPMPQTEAGREPGDLRVTR